VKATGKVFHLNDAYRVIVGNRGTEPFSSTCRRILGLLPSIATGDKCYEKAYDDDSLAALRDISERTVGNPRLVGLIREAVRNSIEEYKKKT